MIKKHIGYSVSDYDQLQEAEEDELLDYQTLKSAIFDPQVLERL
jgi:thiamine monophosphate synthase